MKDVEIRAATEQDIPGILTTMRLALGETPLLQRTPDLWHWKHDKNPFGQSIALVAAAEDGTIAGVRAFMRWELNIGTGETIRCVRPVDTATHPEFTRKGIFRSLTMAAVDIARDDGVDLVFNTPNEQSAPGYLKMGWKHVTFIGAQVRPRLGRSLPPTADDPPRIERLLPYAKPAVEIEPMAGDIPDSSFHTPRSESYLRWRFTGHPHASYGWVPGDLKGGLVVRASERRGRSELVASDLLGVPSASPFRTVAREGRARYVAGWFSPGSAKRTASIRGGLLPVPGLKALRLVALPLTEPEIDPFDIRSWSLSTSDLELL